MPNLTTNYSYNKPLVNDATDEDLWGGYLNDNWDAIDDDLYNHQPNKVEWQDKGALTISSGAVTVTGSNHTIDTEGAASSDDLDTISGGTDGYMVTLRADNATRTVVIKHNTGNILTFDGQDISLDETRKAVLAIYDSALSSWLVVSSTVSDTVATQAVKADILAETNENTYVPPDLLKHHKGIAKAWATFDGTTGSTNDSYNVSSIVRDNAGDWTITLSITMASATNYVVALGYERGNSTNAAVSTHVLTGSRTTTGFQIHCDSSVSGTDQDLAEVSFVVYGDLA